MPKVRKFEDGDRVRVVSEPVGAPDLCGEVGTVGPDARPDADEFDVTFDDGFVWVYGPDDLVAADEG